jgi:hypothetical protein
MAEQAVTEHLEQLLVVAGLVGLAIILKGGK